MITEEMKREEKIFNHIDNLINDYFNKHNGEYPNMVIVPLHVYDILEERAKMICNTILLKKQNIIMGMKVRVVTSGDIQVFKELCKCW